jgi:3-phosphoshikimate 1-carboxyvinyltransferase
VQPLAGPLQGEAVLPGDKSISHRAFLLNTLGSGSARLTSVNDGADVRSTIACLRLLGTQIVEDGGGFRVEGRSGRLRCPASVLDCGNSGTTLRLLAGLLAAQSFTATLDGDASLRQRPMTRIAQPLRRMGARVEGPDNGAHPPLVLTGSTLIASEFELQIASAQLKSCLLLAAVAGAVELRLREPHRSRDHTERMLLAMGADLSQDDGWIRLRPTPALQCVDVDVPGDPSSLALLSACLCALPGSQLRARRVLLNPTRAAFLDVLSGAGFTVVREALSERAGESVGSVLLRSAAELRAFDIGADELPALIDEIPALAVVAAHARGRSSVRGIRELRVKESDRVAAIESLLRSFEVECGSDEDTLWIQGGLGRTPERLDAGEDHRIVMAAVALSLSAATRERRQVELADLRPADVSFPGFRAALGALGVSVA